MLRDDKTSADSFMVKFAQLKKKLDERTKIHLDSEYHNQLEAYIMRLYGQTCEGNTFDDDRFIEIKEAEMSNLNRLQKLKNGTNYKKDKHKAKRQNEDWG